MSAIIAIVTNIPRPYRRALFGVLEKKLSAEGLELRVLFASDPSKHVRRGLPPGGTGETGVGAHVPGITWRRDYERVVSIPVGLGRVLNRLEPVCVVTGGFGPSAVLSTRWCRSARVPHILWSGAWPGHEGDIGRLRTSARGRLVRNSGACIAYGTAAAEYLISLGAAIGHVFCAWNTVDLEGIASAALSAQTRRVDLATKYGLARKNLLFVGSLVERKGVRELVTAGIAATPETSDWTLHFAGGGPMKGELEALASEAGKDPHFRFHGLTPEGDVAELLGLVDGFLFPTKREAWGLVINEAMACGVPVVASPWAGATRDLIEDGVTGFVVEPTDTEKLAATITRLLSDDPVPKQIGHKGAEAVRAKASLEKAAEGFVAAVRCALEGRRDA
ncbi:MAG: hypothetical protein A2133_08445 [Actinobacteria bacterium RBG_16_64_13]|nr:MAG: hypothetical protein A2133_08445 [Actinobacteria bacterium RBG_16_64_13]